MRIEQNHFAIHNAHLKQLFVRFTQILKEKQNVLPIFILK